MAQDNLSTVLTATYDPADFRRNLNPSISPSIATETQNVQKPRFCAWFCNFWATVGSFIRHTICCKPKIVECDWCSSSVLLPNLEAHLETCTQRKVPCTYCSELYFQTQIAAHVEICYKRTSPCRWCTKLVLLPTKAQHEQICSKRKIACKWCSTLIEYDKLARHQNSICPKRNVVCPMCFVEVKHQDFKEHEEQCALNRESEELVDTSEEFLNQSVPVCRWCSQKLEGDIVPIHETNCSERRSVCTVCKDSYSCNRLSASDAICHRRSCKCGWCEAIVFDKNWSHHQRTCTEVKIRCKWCLAQFARNEIDKHQSSLCNKRVVSCEFCFGRYAFKDKHEHQRNCLKRNVSCGVCKSFAIYDEVHERKPTPKVAPNMQRFVPCPECQTEVLFESLKKHMEQDCSARYTVCTQCQKSVSSLDLQVHQKGECSERPIKCQNCFNLVPLSGAKSHRSSCYKEDFRSYNCGLCLQFCDKKHMLVKHLQVDHSEELVVGISCKWTQLRSSTKRWYMLTKDYELFKCWCFFLGDILEFGARFVGPDSAAKSYELKVVLLKGVFIYPMTGPCKSYADDYRDVCIEKSGKVIREYLKKHNFTYRFIISRSAS